jgi:hypothetical protein
MLEALSKAELEKGNRRAGKRDGHVDICRKLTTDISPVHSHATVDCRRLQTVQAAVPKRSCQFWSFLKTESSHAIQSSPESGLDRTDCTEHCFMVDHG